ncbi:MAG: YncE family protein [Planctomycetia bacterium]
MSGGSVFFGGKEAAREGLPRRAAERYTDRSQQLSSLTTYHQGRRPCRSPVECEECGVAYRVKDDRAGKTIKCKGCGAPIEVPLETPPAPPPLPKGRPAPVADDPEPPRRRKKKKSSAGWGISPQGVFVGIGCGCLGFPVFVIAMALFLPFLQKMRGPRPPRDFPPRPAEVVAAEAGLPAAAAAPLDVAASWKDATDPPAEPPYYFAADRTLRIDLPHLEDGLVVHPTWSNAFATLSDETNRGGTTLQTWNLREQIKIGELRTDDDVGDDDGGVLSPDGKYYVVVESAGVAAPVYDVGAGTVAGRVPCRYLAAVRFAGSNHLLVQQQDRGVAVHRLPSGALERTVPIRGATKRSRALATSPGGKFAAALHVAGSTVQVVVFRVDDGSIAGALPVESKFVSDPEGEPKLAERRRTRRRLSRRRPL